MNKKQAEVVRAKMAKRRDVLRELDFPLVYTKSQLHSGMYGRNVRRQDRNYMMKIRKQKAEMNKNIITVDNYLRNLNTYGNNLTTYNTAMQTPAPLPVEGEPLVPIAPTLIAPIAPLAPNIKLPSIPTVGRRVRRGIRG